MKEPGPLMRTEPLAGKRENGGDSDVGSRTTRRTFLQAVGPDAAALAAHGAACGAEQVVDQDGNPIQGFEKIAEATSETPKGWTPVSAILEDRTPLCTIAEALNMTVAGVVASESAKKDGKLLKVPQCTMPA